MKSVTLIQTSFMTYTAKAIKLKLALENPNVLEQLRVNKYDRKYQIWKREPLSCLQKKLFFKNWNIFMITF